VGTDPERIIREASILLDDAQEHTRRSRVHNPYGDGQASVRIGDAIRSFFDYGRGKSSFRNVTRQTA